ncbi:MAG: hypothetical protein LBP83_03650 [Dysgonamonadaceae bacterium]|jgi:hypothetical protein|nr:hypothetical protein [Dysgonamonadaceae bacterium]
MKITDQIRVLSLLFILLVVTGAGKSDPEISIITDNSMEQTAMHGLKKLMEALDMKHISYEKVISGSEVHGRIVLVAGKTQGNGLAARLLGKGNYDIPQVTEALIIRKTHFGGKPMLVIGGYDNRGLMYGLLDVANRISWSDDQSNPLQYVRETTSVPNIKERGLAMYTMNRAYWESRFYDKHFWTQYLDMMAQNRFNMLEILFGYENGGFMAPCYPYFFHVEGFPEVKMADITVEQQQLNVATMNQVIEMAHGRGINIRLGIWDHIYRGGVQAGGNPDFEYSEGKPLPWQITGLDSTNLNRYTQAAFAKFLKTFPNLDAILFKTNNESGLKENELHEFSLNFFETVKENAPNMMIDIHSKGITDTLIRSAIQLGIKFRIAPKFWMEQMGMPFSPTHINREDQKNRRHGYANMLRYPQHYQMLWKLWNGGTNRAFLWGSPEYVKRFVESCHLYNSEAYAVYEPLATKMESQMHDAKPFQLLDSPYQYYNYEFERYWYFFQTFGLIGYDPYTPDDIWNKEFEKRFGKTAGVIIKQALDEASWILPRIVASCYPYSFFPTTSAWPEKQRLGDLPLYAKAEGSDLQQFASFDEEAQVLLGTLETAKTLPSTTSLWLTKRSEDVKKKIEAAEKIIDSTSNKEFYSTITDLKMLSNLALFHARRIPAAISYCLFLRTKDITALDEAIIHEQNATEAWKQLVDAAGNVYAKNILIGKKSLSGHWKDEWVLLNKGLEKLKEQRIYFTPDKPVKTSPRYICATDTDNSRYFTVVHTPIDTVEIGQPIVIKANIDAPAGVKWVRLLYRAVNQYKDFEMLPMITTDGKTHTFQTTIRAEQIDPQYDLMYLIEMMDRNNKGFIYPNFNKETPYKIINLKR